MIEIKEVKCRKDLHKFIHIPEKIHKNHTNWLPPIYFDEWNFFNPKKNKSFDYCDTILLLAIKDGEVVGRIMGIINRRYNLLRNESNGRFGYLECYDDAEVSHALIKAIVDWAKAKEMNKLIGPYGFSDKDPQGFMIEGFEYPPIIDAPCNLPYMISLVEQEGFTKEVDCLIYKYDIPEKFPELHTRILQRFQEKSDYKVIEFTKRSQIKPYIIPVLHLMNEGYSNIYGFVPLNDREMNDFAARYMPLLDPRFLKIIAKDGEIAGFVIGLPSLTKGIQKSKGHILPFGYFQIIWTAKRSKQLDMMLGSVKPKYQGLGLEIPMALRLLESARKAKMETMEVHLILETNHKMLAEVEKIGAKVIKRFRVFQKSI